MNPVVIYRLAAYYMRSGMPIFQAVREAFRNNRVSRKFK